MDKKNLFVLYCILYGYAYPHFQFRHFWIMIGGYKRNG